MPHVRRSGLAAGPGRFPPVPVLQRTRRHVDRPAGGPYRALSAGLGLEEVEEARERLRQRRLVAQKVLRSAQEQLAPLLGRLREASDERAQVCATALAREPWELEPVSAVILGDEDGAAEVVSRLRRLSSFEVPGGEEIASISAELRSAAAELESAVGTPVERDLAVAGLLDGAIRFHANHGDQPCPVCREGVLDDSWQARAVEERDALRRRAAQLESGRKRMEKARERVIALPSSFPLARQGEGEGIPAGAFEQAMEHWASKDSITDPAALADHLERSGAALEEAAELLREAARRELDRLRAEWLPLARDLTSWLEAGRRAESVRESIAQLRSAEDWIRDAAGILQEERFRPIAEEAGEVWKMLRQQSNVDLREIVLNGTGNHGKVELDVTVDGRPGVALGVMSQGELHSLALSLFFPRARRPESPFRFVVIDDPVQSMDPSRVDGLARVLELCSRDRQVLVFTHDARLAESVRRLQIPATILQVTRAADSRVHLDSVQDPIARYLDDARALICTSDLPVKVKRRAVPGLCRHALEAACDEAVRRRRLARGETSIQVESLLESCHRLTERAALAFCDDLEQAGEVHHRLRNIGPWAVECFNHCNRGSHELSEIELDRIVADTGKLAEKIRRAL